MSSGDPKMFMFAVPKVLHNNWYKENVEQMLFWVDLWLENKLFTLNWMW